MTSKCALTPDKNNSIHEKRRAPHPGVSDDSRTIFCELLQPKENAALFLFGLFIEGFNLGRKETLKKEGDKIQRMGDTSTICTGTEARGVVGCINLEFLKNQSGHYSGG